MKYVIVGLGAVGGTLAVRLTESGHQVTGIARGPHLEACRAHGLRLETPEATTTAAMEIHEEVQDARPGDADAVILAVKSHDTAAVLDGLAGCAPPETPVLCAQNGVANEASAKRQFSHVYGVVVNCPTEHLEPGVVRAYSAPVTGVLDVGRYPSGEDEVSTTMAKVLAGAGFDSRSIEDVTRWKYAKLLTNLGNAVEVICGPAARSGTLTHLLQTEARQVLDRAGIACASTDEANARWGSMLSLQPIGGRMRAGGSMWQSISRRRSETEVDYLNGEICRLGQGDGMATPANALVQRLTAQVARGFIEPGTHSQDEVIARLQGGV